jgi:hypothetical protein
LCSTLYIKKIGRDVLPGFFFLEFYSGFFVAPVFLFPVEGLSRRTKKPDSDIPLHQYFTFLRCAKKLKKNHGVFVSANAGTPGSCDEKDYK